MEIMLLEGDRQGYERYAALVAEAGRIDPRYPRLARFLWGNPDEQRAAVDSLSGSGTDILYTLEAAIYHHPDMLPYALERFSSLDTANWAGHFNGRYIATMAAIAGGQLDVATESINWMRASDRPGIPDAGQAIRLMAALGGVTDPSDAADAIEHFRALAGEDVAHYLEALLALAAGDTARARSGMREADPTGLGERRHQIRGMRGWLSLLEGDTVQALQDLQTAIDSLPPPGFGGGGQMTNILHLLQARVQARQPETHDEGLRRLRYGFPIRRTPLLYPASLLALAEALEEAGDPAGAALAYADFVDLWESADASLPPRVETARAAVARLTGERN
jgi:hypothetical protein